MEKGFNISQMEKDSKGNLERISSMEAGYFISRNRQFTENGLRISLYQYKKVKNDNDITKIYSLIIFKSISMIIQFIIVMNHVD